MDLSLIPEEGDFCDPAQGFLTALLQARVSDKITVCRNSVLVAEECIQMRSNEDLYSARYIELDGS